MVNLNEVEPVLNNPVVLLQKLIQFDTTNPPGNETECIRYLADLLSTVGIETILLEKKPGRLNLVARLKGNGDAPPFLLYGHADVVTAAHQQWTYPPFEGRIADGQIWGRGALDMKGALAMMLAAVTNIHSSGNITPGDIILAVVSDEEDEGEYGARFLTDEHAELFKNVSQAIGEIGGFTMHLDQKRFYPIMIAEKQKCILRTLIKGPGGHGSIPVRNGAMAKLGYLLDKLNTHPLPTHITPPVKLMLRSIASKMSFPANIMLQQLLNPVFTNQVSNLLGDGSHVFTALLHNTVNPTIVRGGDKINVIPTEIEVNFDGRLLPGFEPRELLAELKTLFGISFEFEVVLFIPGPRQTNLKLFDLLAEILQEAAPEAIPVPFVISGTTDARYFARLGIQTYGFTPMILPQNFDFPKLIHAADERLPLEALEFGTRTMTTLLQRVGNYL